jgi:hypothetical protein
MTIYFSLLFIVMATALTSSLRREKILWLFVSLFFIVVIGFRYEVGGDWDAYLLGYENIQGRDFSQWRSFKDKGFYLINYLSYQLGFGIYGVNIFMATLFMIGLVRLSRKQFDPWLAFLISIPYLVIVVSMGYTRQAAAIGLVMLSISYLYDRELIKATIAILIAGLFHKTALLSLAALFFISGGSFYLVFIVAIFIVISLIFPQYISSLMEYYGSLIEYYVLPEMYSNGTVEYQSEGAFFRALNNAFFALIILIFKEKWKQYYNDYPLWRMVAIISIMLLFVVNEYSTAVDRLLLYFSILQIVVIGRLPLLARDIIHPQVITLLVSMYSFAILSLWLAFATHAHHWNPYQNILFNDIF